MLSFNIEILDLTVKAEESVLPKSKVMEYV